MSENSINIIEKYLEFQNNFRTSLKEIKKTVDQDTFHSKGHVVESINDIFVLIEPNENSEGLNSTHIVGNLLTINDELEFIQSSLNQSSLNPHTLSVVSEIDKQIKIIKNLTTDAENEINPKSLGQETGDYLSIALETQMISNDFEIIANELKNESTTVSKNMVKKIENVCSSIIEKARSIKRVAYGTLKQSGKKLWSSVKSFVDKIKKGLIKFVDEISKFLRQIISHFEKLLALMVGAMFEFVSWVQNIATDKKFKIISFNVEIPSLEFKVVMIGVWPIPIPKIQTPKFLISFAPTP